MDKSELMNHEGGTHPEDQTSETGTGNGLLRSRLVPIAVTAVVLVAGLLLARRLGIGGNLMAGVGIFAFMMLGRSFMHGGHASRGGNGSHGMHGGCGMSHRQSSSNGQATGPQGSSTEDPQEPWESAETPRRHQGCH